MVKSEEGLILGAFPPGLTFILCATRASSSKAVCILAWLNTKMTLYLSAGYCNMGSLGHLETNFLM